MAGGEVRDCLVVDDEADLYEIYKSYLQELLMFRNVLYAMDGVAATQMIQNQEFRLIILDIGMPKKNGIQFLEQNIKHVNMKKAQVLLVSGNVTADVIQRAVVLGIRNVLTKPFTKEEFQSKVRKLMDAVISRPTDT